MLSRTRSLIFTTTTMLVLLMSLATPLSALADDANPPTDAPTSEPAAPPTDAPAPTQDVSAPTADPTEAPTDAATSLPEAVDPAPTATAIVVLNQDGTPEPLATQAAAEILAGGDPYFYDGTQFVGYTTTGTCPGTVTVCNTVASGAIQAAVNAYQATSSATGSIFVEAGSYAENVVIDASMGNLVNLSGLTGAGSATTTVTGSIAVANLSNPFTLSGFTVQNSGGNGVLIFGSADITVDDVVVDNAAGAGAWLDNCNYNSGLGACTTSGNVSVTASQFNNNTNDDGLYVDSGGAITVDNVTAHDNQVNGAELWATGTTPSVAVTGSTFHTNHGDGLQVHTTGTTDLTSVTASDNSHDGTFIESLGDVTIDGGVFGSAGAANGYYGIDVFSAGNITLKNNVASSYNGIAGAYLDAREGTGAISISNSNFDSNADGLVALASQGNITLDNAQENGGVVSGLGAFLKTFDGGNIFIQNSTFDNNLGPGLMAISSGTGTYDNVTADNNGSDGALYLSTYSFACFGPKGIVVTVNGGTYQANDGYGFVVAPGPMGSLTLGTTPAPDFTGGNGSGDYLLDLSDPCQKSDEPEEEYPPKKPVNEVDVPSSGGTPVEQDCDTFSGTLLHLPNGDESQVDCPFDGNSLTESLDAAHLPHALPAGATFVSAQSVGLTADGQPVDALIDGATLTVSFTIPEGVNARRFSIMFWDTSANDGAGGWVELPVAHFGNPSFRLHPDDPNDSRMILSGVQVVDGKVTVTVNFPGIFALVAH